MFKLNLFTNLYNSFISFNKKIVPKIALMTLLVSSIAMSVLYFTFDYFIENDIKNIQSKKITNEFHKLSSYIKNQQSNLLLLAHTAFRDEEVNSAISNSNNMDEFNKWAKRYISINTKLHELDSLTIWSYDDGLIASTDHIIGNMTISLANYNILESKFPQSGIIKLGDEIWIVAITPILLDGFKMGTIQFSRNISNKFRNEISIISNLKLSTMDEPEELNSLPVNKRLILANTIDGKQIYIQPDKISRDAIENNSRTYTIAIILLVSAILFIIFISILRKETLPFKKLEQLFQEIDESKFSSDVHFHCCSEATAMYKAYKDILIKLQYIKEQEVILNQKTKLISIGKLAARISHDINNPLSIVRSISDIGRNTNYSNDKHVIADMSNIYKQIDRCINMSNNLLNIYTKTKAQTQPIKLNEIVSKYVKYKNKDVNFIYKITDLSEEVKVLAEYNLCEHILDILINNAKEANSNSTINIKLINSNNWGIIEITDNGVGFPQSSQDEIFDLFFTTKLHGNGIGLSNALSLAHAINGTLQVTNASIGQISFFLKKI